MNAEQKEGSTKVVLTGIYLGVFFLIIALKYFIFPDSAPFELSTLDLILLAFATVRMGRMIAYDRVMEPFRRPFADTVPDWTGAGETTEPRGEGIRRAIGELVTCPICSGTWAAALLVYALVLFPGPARIFITIMAAIGMAEILNYVIEVMCWTGHLQRLRIGAWEQKKEEMPEESLQQNQPDDNIFQLRQKNGDRVRQVSEEQEN